jgi:hypothetical protein
VSRKYAGKAVPFVLASHQQQRTKRNFVIEESVPQVSATKRREPGAPSLEPTKGEVRSS